jgi:hypothetical protein
MATYVYKLELGGLYLDPSVIASTYVGDITDIWADASNPAILRRGDGSTPGGHVIGGSGFSGSYNDLVNLPTIPTDIQQLTDVNNLLGNGVSGFDGSFGSLTGIPSTTAGYNITDVFSGDYNDLTNKPVIPTIPTTNSSFTNDSGYITSADLNNLSIDLLQDVDTTTPPTNGQVLVWNSTTNVWEPGTVSSSSGPENLDDLNDVTYGVVTLDGSNGGGLFLGWSQFDNAWRPLDVTIDWNLVTNKPSLLTSETVTTLSLAANTLSYVDENGAQTDLDLSLYLDDTNAARITQGVYDNNTGLATFTRDDTTTFTVDFNSLLAGAGISLSDISGTGDIAFNQTTGEISFNNTSGYSTFDGDYNSLTNTPTIPSDVSDLTDTTNLLSGGGGDASTLDSQAPSYYLDYNNFTNTPTIPTDYGDHSTQGYLTSYTETDTLQSVIDRGNTSTTTAVIPFLYADQTAFPNASTYHGAIAHSHSDGAMYFAHGGVWNKLANDSQLSAYLTSYTVTESDVTAHEAALTITESQISDLGSYSTFDGDYNSLTNIPTLFDGQYSSLTGTPTIPADVSDLTDTTNLLSGGGSGIALTDLSVTQAAASGSGTLAYNSTTGVFTYTPPDLGNAIVDQAQYTTTVTSNAADTSDTSAYIMGNTGSASATGTSTGWVFADVVQDPDNPGTTTILDVDSAIFTGSVVGDITTGSGTQTIQGTVDFTNATSVDFTGVTISGLTNGIDLTDLSVTTAANGVAGLSYDNTSGVFTFTPPDLSGYLVSGGTINVSSIEPTATTSGDGDDLTITGGDATDLNSQGGDTIITGGSGALTSGSVDIGTTQTDAITIGATGIGTTIGDTLTVNGNATFESGTFEAFSTITGASGTVTHDCDNGHIFYHTSPSANFTANFTNLGLSTNYGTGMTLVIDQGATARIPSAVQTDGVSRTIVWQGGSAPSGTNNGVDVVSFSILRTSGSYIVLGQLVDFA